MIALTAAAIQDKQTLIFDPIWLSNVFSLVRGSPHERHRRLDISSYSSTHSKVLNPFFSGKVTFRLLYHKLL
ncbi:MAG: hypothetical protein ACRD5J_10145, partial [Nitrososphaeraceae archaeon]